MKRVRLASLLEFSKICFLFENILFDIDDVVGVVVIELKFFQLRRGGKRGFE